MYPYNTIFMNTTTFSARSIDLGQGVSATRCTVKITDGVLRRRLDAVSTSIQMTEGAKKSLFTFSIGGSLMVEPPHSTVRQAVDVEKLAFLGTLRDALDQARILEGRATKRNYRVIGARLSALQTVVNMAETSLSN